MFHDKQNDSHGEEPRSGDAPNRAMRSPTSPPPHLPISFPIPRSILHSLFSTLRGTPVLASFGGSGIRQRRALCSLFVLLLALPAHGRPLRVLAVGYGVSTNPQIPASARRWAAPDAALQQRLARRGITIETTMFTPGLTAAFLRRFDVVVLLGMPRARLRGEGAVMARKQLSLLHKFVARGGGLLYLHAPAWSLGSQTAGINQWLKRHGASVLLEQVVESHASRLHHDPKFKTILGWTGNIARHTVTRGVKGYFYPVAHNAWHNFTQPVRVGRRWTVLLRGEATAHSVRPRSGDASRVVDTRGTYTRAPPIVAVRSAGAGRLALWPVASTCLWQDGYHRRWGAGLMMEGRLGPRRGDALVLLERLLRWLGRSKPMQAVPAVKAPGPPAPRPPKLPAGLPWDRLHMRGKILPRHYVGLIGAQSNLSVGSAPPQQMIRAARDAGYHFVAFTEQLSRMTAEKTRRLIEACRAGSSKNFQAVPGFYYKDEAGNAHVVFGPLVRWPRADWFSKRKPGRITYNNVLFRGLNFMPLAVVQSSSNPKKPWLLGNYTGFAVYTYEDGKRVDDSLSHYRTLQGMGYNLFPMVLHLTRSPGAVKAARSGAAMQTYVRWSRGRDPVTALTGALGAVHHNKRLHYYPAFVSEGPIIEDFWTLNAGTSDLTLPGRQRHRTHVQVSSAAGLKQVDLRLGPRRRYRYLTRGKQFSTTVDGFHDRQRAPLLEVLDAAGRRAISWSRLTAVQEYSFVSGADNFNTIHSGKWAAATLQPLRGIEDRVRLTPVGLLPRFLVDRPAGKLRALPDTVRPAVRQDARVASRFGSVVEYSVDGHYPPSTTGNWNRAVVEPWQANRNLGFRVRVTRYCPRPDGAVVDLVETTLTALTDLILPARDRRGLSLMRTAGSRGLHRLEASGPGGKVVHKILAAGSPGVEEKLEDGGYVSLSPAPGGSVAFVPLQAGLSFYAWRHPRAGGLWLLGGHPGQRLPAGQSITFRFLSVNSGLGPATKPGAAFVKSVIQKMGLSRHGRTIYKVKARRGKVLGKRFVLSLAASRGAFSGTISQASLPLDLPVRVRGLHARWDALLWYRGEAQYLVPVWKTGQHRVRTAVRQRRRLRDELRRFPVARAGGMLQIDTELGARDVFVGHPVQASDPRLHILLTDTRPGRERVWLHNSERRPITATVWRDPDFTLIPAFRRKVTVPPGGSLCIRPRKAGAKRKPL